MVYLLETSPVSTETRVSSSDCLANESLIDDRPHIVFVTGALVSKSFQFEAARRLGLCVIVIDGASSSGAELQKTGEIDLFVPLELSLDVDLAVVQIVDSLEFLNRNIVGVVTFMEMAVLLASKVASSLCLPGLCPHAVAIARDKNRMREAMRRVDLASVASFCISREEEIVEAGKHVGFPAVLKPIIGADSLGVKRVNSMEELEKAFDEGVKVMHSLCITSGFLSAPSTVVGSLVESKPILPVEFLLEEYLDGPEVDIDVLLHNGDCVYSAVSDNGETVEPYFTETYGILPSLLPEKDQEEVIKLSIDSVVKGLGLSTGLFHIEGKLTSRGPRLIEINCRLGGGPICEMHKRVAGIDLAEQQIRIAVGLAPSIELERTKKNKCFAYMTTNAVGSGTIGSDLGFLSKYKDDVSRLMCRVKPGDCVMGPEDGQPSWLVEIWMESDRQSSSPRSLVERILSVSDEIAMEFQRNYECSGKE